MQKVEGPVKRVISLMLLCVSLTASAEDSSRTIKTIDGATYVQARVTELRPAGVAVTTESGIAVIPYDQLPADLRQLYVPDPAELSRVIGSSVDGTYEMPQDRTGLGGERLFLKNGTFAFGWWNDATKGGRTARALHTTGTMDNISQPGVFISRPGAGHHRRKAVDVAAGRLQALA
jgi:hypothetical protein